MLAHDDGVLVAPPGTGKTVIACALIAERKLPTLVLAHSKPLLEQWRAQLQTLLGLPPKQIGQKGGGRARAALLDQIENTPANESLVVIATGQYLGEGFDCPQLDTLFLAFPVSFKGRLVQYTGRLMRAHDRKTSVRVYDYADVRVPVLRAMHMRRLTTYKSLGFRRQHDAPRLVMAA